MTETELDMRGTLCPEPVLAAARALKALPPGGRLRLRADDPVAGIDITHFCRVTGHALLETAEGPDGFCFLIARRDG